MPDLKWSYPLTEAYIQRLLVVVVKLEERDPFLAISTSLNVLHTSIMAACWTHVNKYLFTIPLFFLIGLREEVRRSRVESGGSRTFPDNNPGHARPIGSVRVSLHERFDLCDAP